MSGNMWEWCQDGYGRNYYGDSPVDNPMGRPENDLRVLRGGGWNNDELACRVAERIRHARKRAGSLFGFRVCVSVGSLD